MTRSPAIALALLVILLAPRHAAADEVLDPLTIAWEQARAFETLAYTVDAVATQDGARHTARGQVRLWRTENGLRRWLDLELSGPAAEVLGEQVEYVDYGDDGLMLLTSRRQALQGPSDAADFAPLIARLTALVVPTELTRGEPFLDLNRHGAGPETESAELDGVTCDVWRIGTDERWDRWWIDYDGIPRRVEEHDGARHVEMSLQDVRYDAEIDTTARPTEAPDGYQVHTYAGGARVGQPAPGFTLAGPDGTTTSLADLRGQVVLLDFWATWCLPCKQAMPGLQRLHEELADEGLVVIGVDTMELRADHGAAAYMRKKDLTYRLLLDADSSVAELYGVRAIPRVFVIDRDGTVLHSAEGFSSDLEEQLHAVVVRALAAD